MAHISKCYHVCHALTSLATAPYTSRDEFYLISIFHEEALFAMEEETTDGVKILAKNRKAHFHYEIEESLECGIELKGSEVKSFRLALVSFPDAFATIENNQVWLRQLHISEYTYSSIFNHEPDRVRRLLLHRHEIRRLKRKVEEKGYTLVPLSFYLKNRHVKVELGICKGKKIGDKRAAIKERDVKRDVMRELRDRNT